MPWIDDTGETRPNSWEEYCVIEARTRCLPYWMCAKNVSRARLLRMRIRLYRADPHCFWCGVEVVLDKTAERLSNFATVDHLYSRWHPERKARHVEGQGVLHVLACSSCNGERAGCENQQQPFIPKLPERLEFAQLADATLARKAAHSVQLDPTPQVESPRTTIRVICTLEEAIAYAKENPAR